MLAESGVSIANFSFPSVPNIGVEFAINLFCFRLRRKNQIKIEMIAAPTTPTTTPAIIGVFDELPVGTRIGVEVDVAAN
jgi:hypothetical protein